jgi:hypothetical protein
VYSVIAIAFRMLFDVAESGLGSKTGIAGRQTACTLGAADRA